MAAIKTIHEFAPADRYLYDCGLCSTKNGFAQVDTKQDASYFGTWANPFKFMIFCYCEGDTTLQQAENAEDFATAIRELVAWNDDRWIGIDPGWPNHDNGIGAEFEKLGLGDLLH